MASREQVQFHYDVDNDFYELFLDQPYLVYSCGVWKSAQDLETAQIHKLQRLIRYAHVERGDTLMDVGCGWGGLMRYATDAYGVSSAKGLTLSRDQYSFISSMECPPIRALLQSWTEYSPPAGEKFDALVSVGAFEHFASREDRKAGRHRNIYRDFFEWCGGVSTDSAYIGLQTIVTARAPQSIQEVKDTRYLLDKVFPGSALPSISDIQAAIIDQYEISACKRIGADYAKTLHCWRDRLTANRILIEEKYGNALYAHYERYFSCAIRAFDAGVVDLLQLSLKKAPISRVTIEK